MILTNMDKTYKNYKQTMAMLIVIAIVSLFEAIIILPYSLIGSLCFIGITTLMVILSTLEYKNPKNDEARRTHKHAKSLGFDTIEQWQNDVEMGYIP